MARTALCVRYEESKMIEITNDFIFIQANDKTAQQLDAVYVKSKKAWKVPNTLGALRELHRLGYDVAEYGKRRSRQREEVLKRKNPETAPNYDDRLRPYQNQDIDFLSQIPNSGLFSEQRTGKSAVALKLMELEESGKHLVVCPATLVLNWSNETKKWTSLTPFPVSGSKAKRMKIYNQFKEAAEGVLIISKDTLRSDVDVIESL